MISTRWRPREVKSLADECVRLDVRWLQREGVLERLVISHRVTLGPASLTVSSVGEAVFLSYDVRNPLSADRQHVSQRVGIDRTRCNFGGARAWFLCTCGRRCAVLYCRERNFSCRRCLGLAYQTQREHVSGRGFLRYERIRRRLGIGYAEERRKPKGMHWRTFEHLMAKADAAYERGVLGSLPKRWMPWFPTS
jgi:hypothetical protein